MVAVDAAVLRHRDPVQPVATCEVRHAWAKKRRLVVSYRVDPRGLLTHQARNAVRGEVSQTRTVRLRCLPRLAEILFVVFWSGSQGTSQIRSADGSGKPA
jgi:hypothetical protein